MYVDMVFECHPGGFRVVAGFCGGLAEPVVVALWRRAASKRYNCFRIQARGDCELLSQLAPGLKAIFHAFSSQFSSVFPQNFLKRSGND
jgi:hypothetical protein